MGQHQDLQDTMALGGGRYHFVPCGLGSFPKSIASALLDWVLPQ